jgi:hypothetical protein
MRICLPEFKLKSRWGVDAAPGIRCGISLFREFDAHRCISAKEMKYRRDRAIPRAANNAAALPVFRFWGLPFTPSSAMLCICFNVIYETPG